jgi:HTH-type transcriptional regulator/antitoxin HigA
MDSKKEYHEAMAEIEKYLEKGFSALSAPEENHLQQLSREVQAYEEIHYPMPVKYDLTTLLEAYISENGLTQKKLAEIMGVGNSTLSEIMNKKRPVTLDFAKKLHEKIHFDGNMILEML